MWREFRRVSNLLVAEMWRELLEGEGIPVRILPENREGVGFPSYRLYVPKLKAHVVEEILRKL